MKIVDLFAGCGGLSLGFQSARKGRNKFTLLAAYDAWGPAVETYAKNFDHHVFKMNLLDADAAARHIDVFVPDIIIGGPPCQDFSHAGKRDEGGQADLTVAFAEIVVRVKPTWFLMENVDRAKNSVAYKKARCLLKKAGYGLTETVVDASRCGVPQKRLRFFCIGRQDERDGFLQKRITAELSSKRMTLRDYFGEQLGIEHFYRHPRNYNRRAVFSVNEPAPTIRGVNRPIPEGYPGHKNDTMSVRSSSVRSLSTEERAMIQTFPDDYTWQGTKTDKEQLIGNAVPVKLAEFMAKRILEHEESRTLKTAAKAKIRERSFEPAGVLFAA